MITVEQIVNTQKTNIDTLFGLTGRRSKASRS